MKQKWQDFIIFLLTMAIALNMTMMCMEQLKMSTKTRIKMSMMMIQVIFCRHASCWALMLPHNKWKPVAPLHQVPQINNNNNNTTMALTPVPKESPF